ncbi:Gfo/Idh/MocA family protein [Flammeovirga sp. OC4]|uniref:Gfo/Idh/MocA family protein n=1 Tax=Flammeovirga sp. OC4 TaxID=1382345 RepID=UPI0005C6ACA0|nr:Gfo/Idh/MocA family oxidoreductase [Flammeovirga sp. OC4]
MSYKNNIRWGIIGCGDVTEVKSGPAYQLTEGFELKAVMRRNAEKAQDYAQRHKVEKHYSNADELINDPEIDAVYIATPPDAHLHYALKVAEAGKICCIEKPLAPSYSESLIIYESFKKKNLPLFVAYYRRSLPRFTQIKTWLENNEIGEVRHINWKLTSLPKAIDLTGEYNWRTDSDVATGGYFDDLASHGLDFFVYLLGEMTNVAGFSTNQQGHYTAKDAITACWMHKGGITGSGYWNFGVEQEEDIVEIIGSKGTIKFSVFKEEKVVIKTGNTTLELDIDHPKHVQLHHVENMKKDLFEDEFSHPSKASEAVHVSWVMDKILGKLNDK